VRSPLGHIAEGSALVLEASILVGDAVARLRELPDGVARTCVTSPPYWGLRDYGNDGQLGLEGTPQEFVENLCLVFDEVRRVLADDGTVWVNLGDSYIGYKGANYLIDKSNSNLQKSTNVPSAHNVGTPQTSGLKTKDLVGIPWRFAFAMQDRGWYLRQDIIWAKPNPMPESVTDRCTKSHEYIFLLSKKPRYFFDNEAIKEPSVEFQASGFRAREKPVGESIVEAKKRGHGSNVGVTETRNKRSVWAVTTKPFRGAHFAVYPPALIEPCILAGSAEGDTVLDPFSGSGTTGEVALKNGRNYVGIELNPEYAKLSEKRISEAIGMFGQVRVESC
jgi:DNA modification methylase